MPNKTNTRSGQRPGRPGPRDARERRERARELARTRQRRRQVWWAVAAVAAVVVVIAVFVALKLTQNGGSAKVRTANAATVAKVVSVPAAVLNTVGKGTAGPLTPIPTQLKPRPLLSGGKPEILYIGAEYCPYCAAERWAMVNALSRFGTWSGLAQTQSSATDVYPNTRTFSFRSAHLSSRYIVFKSWEVENRLEQRLQTPSAQANNLAVKLYGSSYGFPFVDIANLYADDGSQYAPPLLHVGGSATAAGLSWSTIAADMQNPHSAVGKAIDGTANTLTAGICKAITASGDTAPASVCTAPGVVSAEGNLNGKA
jgi:hypothetical protein